MAKGVDIKIFGTVMIALFMLSACSKYTYVPDSEKHRISFSPYGASLTKSSTALGQDKTFGVYAFYADCLGGTSWNDSKAWGKSSEYFSDAKFAYSDGFWGGSPTPYYWPLSGSLMFAGYCPHQSVSDAVTSVSLEPNKTDVNPYLQIEFTQKTTPSEIVDLLWFDVQNSGMGKTQNLGM